MVDIFDVYEKLQHPLFFGELTGKLPYPSQVVMLLCPHRRKMISAGRGVGKSDILIGQGAPAAAIAIPVLRAKARRVPRQVPFRGFLMASVKDQAFALQDSIYNAIHSHEFIASHLSNDTTKTQIRFKDGGLLTIRPATGAARGGHAQVVKSKVYGMVKGVIKIWVDEAWFIDKENFFRSVVEPMLMIGGPGSGITYTTTPYGKQGPAWDIYNASSTGECMQEWVADPVTGRRSVPHFDKKKCGPCQLCNHTVRFNLPSWENPYANLHELLATIEDLRANGLSHVVREEYEGIPDDSVALFYNQSHQEKMWDDELPRLKLRQDGVLVWQGLSRGYDEELYREFDLHMRETDEVELVGRPRGGDFYLGVDPNRGIESRRVDFAAVSLIEDCSRLNGARVPVPLRLCERFKKPLPYFNGRDYRPHELTLFMIDLVIYLALLFDVRKVFLDQGGGGEAYYWPLVQALGEHRVEYIRMSEQDQREALYHHRMLVESHRTKSPPIDFLKGEVRHVTVEGDALEQRDKVKIEKAKPWGTVGAEVDGLFTWAYACRGVAEGAPLVMIAQSPREVKMPRSLGRRTGRLPGRVRTLDSIRR